MHISTLLIYKIHIIVFISYGEEITVFGPFLEAIDIVFVRTNYQLLKITFQSKQKMVVPKDTFLQTWQDVCFFFVKFHQDKTSAFSANEFSLVKKTNLCLNLLVNWILFLLLCVLAFISNFLCRLVQQKILGNIISGSWALGLLGSTRGTWPVSQQLWFFMSDFSNLTTFWFCNFRRYDINLLLNK